MNLTLSLDITCHPYICMLTCTCIVHSFLQFYWISSFIINIGSIGMEILVLEQVILYSISCVMSILVHVSCASLLLPSENSPFWTIISYSLSQIPSPCVSSFCFIFFIYFSDLLLFVCYTLPFSFFHLPCYHKKQLF